MRITMIEADGYYDDDVDVSEELNLDFLDE